MRSSKEAERFPYDSKTVCYFTVDGAGNVVQLHYKDSFNDAYNRAVSGEVIIYAVWPGQWSSDLFVIDDLEEFAKGKNISR